MKIFCPTCKMYILDTAPAFICGGPYSAEQFAPGAKTTAAQYNVTALKSRKPEQLPCPRCKKPFIRRDGALLTEHGLIAKGQATVDMSKSIVHQGGSTAGLLMTAQEWSQPCTTYSERDDKRVPQDFGPLRVYVDTISPDFTSSFDINGVLVSGEKSPYTPEMELPSQEIHIDIKALQKERDEAERQSLIATLHAAGQRVHPNTGLEKLRARVKKLGEKGE